MKITNIKQQEKRKDRYSIFVDGKYAFSLSESALLDQKLAGGQELDAARLKAFKKLSADDKAYGNALRYVALRPRSEGELRDYFRRKNIEEPVAEHITKKLRQIGLLDDQAFARAWVASRRALKSISTRKLRLELKQKRVAEETIAQVMEEDQTDENEVLRALIAKKRTLSKYKNDELKLMQYLTRQGFGYDAIKTSLRAEE
jgi:regulatory protein